MIIDIKYIFIIIPWIKILSSSASSSLSWSIPQMDPYHHSMDRSSQPPLPRAFHLIFSHTIINIRANSDRDTRSSICGALWRLRESFVAPWLPWFPGPVRVRPLRPLPPVTTHASIITNSWVDYRQFQLLIAKTTHPTSLTFIMHEVPWQKNT